MVRTYDCTFCGRQIQPGTGLLYVRTDGTLQRFCTKKCRKNTLLLKRKPQGLKWTTKYIKTHAK